jgi:hypothetical protein
MINEAAICSTKAVTFSTLLNILIFLSSPYQWDTVRQNMNNFTLKSYFQNPHGQLHGSNKTHQVSREKKNHLSTEHVFECTKKCHDAKC